MDNKLKNLIRVAISCAVIVFLGSCAVRPTDPEELAEFMETNDPLEPFNRKVFAFNQAVDENFLVPVAKGYRTVVPEEARKSIRNFTNNLKEPYNFVNNLLQLSPDTPKTLARFIINSTIGFLGFFDVASELGLEYDEEDFGQTLALWGIPEGPYLVLPLFGPSNFRDSAGVVVGIVADPVNLTLGGLGLKIVSYSISGLNLISQREAYLDPVEQIKANSLDYYATMRSLYRQRRLKMIYDFDPSERKNLPILRDTKDFRD